MFSLDPEFRFDGISPLHELDRQLLETGTTASQDVINARLLDYMNRVGGLPLTIDDFCDPLSGKIICTNEVLFSLL